MNNVNCKKCICYNCQSNDPEYTDIERCVHCDNCISGEGFNEIGNPVICRNRKEREDA